MQASLADVTGALLCLVMSPMINITQGILMIVTLPHFPLSTLCSKEILTNYYLQPALRSL